VERKDRRGLLIPSAGEDRRGRGELLSLSSVVAGVGKIGKGELLIPC